MSEFTASNGIKVKVLADGQVGVVRPVAGTSYEHHEWTGKETADALREAFRAEEDERLGRFRDPATPGYVAYDRGEGCCRVVREVDGNSEVYLRQDIEHSAGLKPAMVARAFFDAHPEPWHAAKPWETWVITFNGTQEAVTLDEDREFRDRNAPHNGWAHITDPAITAGRRIWPVEEP